MAKGLIDRTRIMERERCHRKRYIGTIAGGRGYQKKALALPLASGSHVHKGLETILTPFIPQEGQEGILFPRLSDAELTALTNEAAHQAREAYLEEVQQRGLDLNKNANVAYTCQEQAALCEALVRGWGIVRLPSFLRVNQILEIEREHTATMGPRLRFMGRPDGVLWNRVINKLLILSFKTAAMYDDKLLLAADNDIQGLSEKWVYEQSRGMGTRVHGIQMEYLIKGKREEYPKDSGQYITRNPLIRGWKWVGSGASKQEGFTYAWKAKYKVPQAAKGNALGMGWEPFDVWTEMGVATWMEMIQAGQVWPYWENPLPTLFKWPDPIIRTDTEVSDWYEQTLHGEAANLEGEELLRKIDEQIAFYEGHQEGSTLSPEDRYIALESMYAQKRSALNRYFPQYRHSCLYPSKCPMHVWCWGDPANGVIADDVQRDPERYGYMLRRPNHELERDQYAPPEA